MTHGQTPSGPYRAFGGADQTEAAILFTQGVKDAHLAILNPHEAVIYLYRGMEWTTGLAMKWEEVAAALNTTIDDIRS